MKRFDNPILVTRPFLPDLDEFKAGIDEVWHNQWLTNNGPLLQRFQTELSKYLGVPETNMALFNNGMLALELGYQAMGLAGGDVITTPFTFVATFHALKRIGATPVFADIDPETLCLDPEKVEKLITPRTKAIVPVHVYGNVCNIEAFDALSKKYGIYTRRYFYPLLTDFAPYIYARNTCPVAQDIASRVLTLPTYYGLPLVDVKAIARNVLEIVKG